jgi:hypothetical protein
MADNSDFLPVILQSIQDNSVIYGLCDGEIYRGQPIMEDAHLQNTQKTCICVPSELNQNTQDLIDGGAGNYLFDTLFEVDVISKDRTTMDNEAYCKTLAHKVRDLLKAFTSATYGGESRHFFITNVSMRSQLEPQINWARYIITGRARGAYSV